MLSKFEEQTQRSITTLTSLTLRQVIPGLDVTVLLILIVLLVLV
jgi:hypothetical protein